jgi:hypothetical protein
MLHNPCFNFINIGFYFQKVLLFSVKNCPAEIGLLIKVMVEIGFKMFDGIFYFW